MLTLYPPNLKIWAERVHAIYSGKEQQGKQSSTDKTNTNIIGNDVGITLDKDALKQNDTNEYSILLKREILCCFSRRLKCAAIVVNGDF